MVFRDVWNYRRKKEQPNRFRQRPTISFRADLEIQPYLNKLKTYNSRSSFINKAIYFYIMFINNPKRILEELISRNFDLSKHILRQIGSRAKKRKGSTKRKEKKASFCIY